MIRLSLRARRHVAQLQQHFLRSNRPEALLNLMAALAEAADLIQHNPHVGIGAPRPYPQVKRNGVAWLRVGRYWIAYLQRPELMISAVYYDTADIPGRF